MHFKSRVLIGLIGNGIVEGAQRTKGGDEGRRGEGRGRERRRGEGRGRKRFEEKRGKRGTHMNR